MADDRMKNDDDLQRNMGKAGEGQNYGQQSPGRGGQEGQHGGQHTGGQQQGHGGYGGSEQQQHKPRNLEEDDEQFGGGNVGQQGGQGRGGQNR